MPPHTTQKKPTFSRHPHNKQNEPAAIGAVYGKLFHMLIEEQAENFRAGGRISKRQLTTRAKVCAEKLSPQEQDVIFKNGTYLRQETVQILRKNNADLWTALKHLTPCDRTWANVPAQTIWNNADQKSATLNAPDMVIRKGDRLHLIKVKTGVKSSALYDEEKAFKILSCAYIWMAKRDRPLPKELSFYWLNLPRKVTLEGETAHITATYEEVALWLKETYDFDLNQEETA